MKRMTMIGSAVLLLITAAQPASAAIECGSGTVTQLQYGGYEDSSHSKRPWIETTVGNKVYKFRLSDDSDNRRAMLHTMYNTLQAAMLSGVQAKIYFNGTGCPSSGFTDELHTSVEMIAPNPAPTSTSAAN